jgi:hypothetical protein
LELPERKGMLTSKYEIWDDTSDNEEELAQKMRSMCPRNQKINVVKEIRVDPNGVPKVQGRSTQGPNMDCNGMR